jgi:hypothetical protein
VVGTIKCSKMRKPAGIHTARVITPGLLSPTTITP